MQSNNNVVEGSFGVDYLITHSVRKITSDDEITKRVYPEGDERALEWDMKFNLDIIGIDDNPFCLARVECEFGKSFRMQRYRVWNRPKKIPPGTNGDDPGNWRCLTSAESADKTNIWRCFESRQLMWGIPPKITFTIVGLGGKKLPIEYFPLFQKRMEGQFFEKRSAYSLERPTSLQPLKLPKHPRDFGFYIQRVTDLSDSDQKGTSQPIVWEHGDDGLKNLRQSVLPTFRDTTQYDNYFVNIIISIDLIQHPNRKDLEKLLKLSQNFIKYEEVFDEVLKISRKKKEPEMIQPTICYAKSNKDAVQGSTNKEKHDMLASCSNTFTSHVEAMNPDADTITNRYKLSYRRVSGSYLVAQFFFEHTPNDDNNLISLIQLCIHFVHNSFRLDTPDYFNEARTIKEKQEHLFSSVIMDRYVEETLLGKNLSLLDCDTSSFKSVSESGRQNLDKSISMISDSILGQQNADSSMSDCTFSVSSSIVSGQQNMDSSISGGAINIFPDSIAQPEVIMGEIPENFTLHSTINNKRPYFEVGHDNDNDNNKKKNNDRDSDTNNLDCNQPKLMSIENLSGELKETLRSDLTNEKKLTAAKLKVMLKKLNAPMSKTKAIRLKNLQQYFDSRDNELKHILKNESMPCMGILGIEILLKNNNDSNRVNNIQIILTGGRCIEWERRGVCKSNFEFGTGFDHITKLTKHEAKRVCEELQPTTVIGAESKIDIYINKIDTYIDGLRKDERNACVFALVHDLLS